MKLRFHHQMIVRQEHLNQYGSIFGGRVLSVIDELAFIACARTYTGYNFVTRAIENAAFNAHARLGDLLEFKFGIESIRNTSVRVKVETLVYDAHTREVKKSFDGCVVMVCVDAEGKPMSVPR